MKRIPLLLRWVRMSNQLSGAILFFGLWIAFGGGTLRAWAAPATTTSTLTVTSGGSAVTSVASGSVVTLTATVVAGSTPLTVGQVNFCVATAASCTDINLLGTAQLTTAGTATFKFTPGVGSHSFKAVFLGTTSYAASTSGTAALAVSGLYLSETTLAQSGSAGNYTLTATVGGVGPAAPSGMVSFLDSSNNNAVLGTATLVAGTAGLSFISSSDPAPGTSSYSIAEGDFNGDGITDLAVANYGSSTVTVLLGNGNGAFTVSASPVTNYNPNAIAVGDLNGDGIPDLAVAGDGVLPCIPPQACAVATLTVLLGNGDGTFTAAATNPDLISDHGWTTGIAVADFNGDGIPDLAVSAWDSGQAFSPGGEVAILLGNGDGTFTATASSPQTGTSPESIAAGDFNGDGIPDLAIANSESNDVTILLGNGDGTFTAAASPQTGTGPESIAVGDFNGDDILDLAVTNTTSNTVTVLLGDGKGNFTAAANPATGVGHTAIAVGDFNGDGIPDLAVTNSGDNTVTILLGKGDGTFTTGATPQAGTNLESIAVGYFNGDSISDIAVANGSSNTVTVLQTATQSATAAAAIVLPLSTGFHEVVASYPGDNSYQPSTSAPISLPSQITPTVTVTPSTSSITTAQALTVTVAVNGGSGNTTPTGSVTLSGGGGYTSLPTTITNGSATFSIPAGALEVGSDTLTANYTPDSASSSIYNSASGTASVTVTPTVEITPQVLLTTSASIITIAQTLTVGVAVDSHSTPGPTGSVTLTSGTYASAATTLSNGSASITIPAGALATGTDTLSATYTPDTVSFPTYTSASGTASVTVTAPPSPSFTVVGTAVTVTPGATTGNTSTITLTPSGGFTGSVTLTAALTSGPSGAVSPPTFSFGTTSPSSVTAAGAGSATLTISTTAAIASGCAAANLSGRGVPWYATGSTALACVLLFGAASKRRRWLALLGMVMLLITIACGAAACGGSSGSACSQVSSAPATTAGIYTVTVTGTSGTTAEAGTITLTVQ